jgi:hypothetical protein
MLRTIKLALMVFIALMTIVLTVLMLRGGDRRDRVAVDPQTTPDAPQGPLDALGLRYDGYYRNAHGSILYLVRFFPEGRAVLANGSKDVEDRLVPMLKRDAIGDPDVGHYNVPVHVSGDSLFFTTTPRRGTIDYSGRALNPDSLVLLRSSNITGTKELKLYVFQRDGAPLPAEPPSATQQ